MDKKALRAEIRAKKRALTEEQIVRYSEELAQKLFAHPFTAVATEAVSTTNTSRRTKIIRQSRSATASRCMSIWTWTNLTFRWTR